MSNSGRLRDPLPITPPRVTQQQIDEAIEEWRAKRPTRGPQLAPGQSLEEFCDLYQEFA